eukprot:m.1637506 g.1637506  ORF g.1637506 m.1637506 type:complete len:600 (-) comp25916_c0_seq1:304-2103(-)
MSIERNKIYAALPTTVRGKKVVLNGDPKGKNFLYCRGNYVICRDLANPLDCFTYNEHPHQATVAKYAPSGFYICSGDAKGNVRIWDTTQDDHKLKYEYRPIGGSVEDIQWTEDSKRIVVGGMGNDMFARAFLWDSGSSVGEISGHTKQINSVDIRQTRPYRVVTGSEDKEVGFYAGPPFKRQNMNKEHGKFVNMTRFSPDGALVASVDAGGIAHLYDGKEGTFKSALNGGSATAHTGGIYGCSWADNGHLLTCSADKTVKLWDVEANKAVTTFTFPDAVEWQQLGCLAQGDYLISTSLNGYINYLDKANPDKPLRSLEGSAGNATAIAVDESAGKLYSGSTDGRVTQWDIASGSARNYKMHHKSEVTAMQMSEGKLISASMDNTVRTTTVDDEKLGASAGVASNPTGLAAGNGGLTVTASVNHVTVYRDGKSLCELAISYEASDVSLHPNAGEVAVGGNDKKVHIYTLSNDTLTERTTYSCSQPVSVVAYSPDGQYLAAGDTKREVYGFETSTGECKFSRWKFHNARISCLAWAPNSAYLASGSLDTNIIIWDLSGPMKRVELKGAHPAALITKIAWGSENTFYSTGNDGCVRSWTFST